MKRHFSLTVLVMSVTACATAQRGLQKASPQQMFQQTFSRLTTQILETQSALGQSAQQSRTTGLTQRMIGRASYGASGLYDSTEYYYWTTDRGAAHNPKKPLSYFGEQEPYIRYGVGSASPEPLYMLYDASEAVQGYPFTREILYDANQRPVSLVITDFLFRSRYTMQYDAAGHLTRLQYLDDTAQVTQWPLNVPPQFRLQSTQYSRYDAVGRKLQDSTHHESIFSPQPTDMRWFRTYNASGQLVIEESQYLDAISGWMPHERNTATYLPNGLLQKTSREIMDTGGWLLGAIDSFGYAGANPSYTFAQYSYFDVDSARFIVQFRAMASLNAVGNWDTLRSFNPVSGTGPLEYTGAYVITYNGFQNRTSESSFGVDASGTLDPLPGYRNEFYYELYEPTTTVSSLPARVSIIATPNPTADVLRVRWGKDASLAYYTLAVLNGRILSQRPIAAGASQLDLRLDDYAAGVYVLTLTGEDDGVLHREKIVRQ